MGLPLYLAMNAAEIAASVKFPPLAWISCHFSPCSEGITNLPLWLPEGSLILLDDRFPCKGHNAHVIARQLSDIVSRFHCGGVILDFQEPNNEEISRLVHALLQAPFCPVAVSDLYAAPFQSAVFLSPGLLGEPLEEHLKPWQGREVWLDVSLCQQQVSITSEGAAPGPVLPWDGNTDGFYDDSLRCHYRTEVAQDAVTFTLFDTAESLERKLNLAAELGVSRAVGLYQELGTFLTGK